MKSILIIVAGGMAAGLTRTPRQYRKMLQLTAKSVEHEWKKDFPRLYRNSIARGIDQLFKKELISYAKTKNGIKLVLTESGKRKIILLDNKSFAVHKPKKWDGKWWIVAFDIPEAKRQARNAIRHKLKAMDFFPIQKSLFVYPFPCRDEIEALAAQFDALDNIHIFRVEDISISEILKTKFKYLLPPV